VWDEDSGELHHEFEDGYFGEYGVNVLAGFLSPDGQVRLVANSGFSGLQIYDPEAGSELHHLRGHADRINDLACIASSSAAPHHPRLVSASYDRTAKVWDGETGERLASLETHARGVTSLTVWKEHTGEGEHDRIATCGFRDVKIWDGEAFTLLHDLNCDSAWQLLAFKSAEGPTRLLVAPAGDAGLQVWDPEEGRLLHDGINRGCPLDDLHLFESAKGRHLLAIVGSGNRHARHPGDTIRSFLDVWDLGEAPPRANPMRAAHHLG
jgi:hypothetical protein